MTTRREMLRGGAAASVLTALGAGGCLSRPDCAGGTLPDWKYGDLDLHFIYTGRGENMFYRFPDGTAVLNDCGEFFRPRDNLPLLPDASRLGGECVSRYIRRVYPERTIDWAIFSHWHTDHLGHADFDVPDTPQEGYRYRTTADGRKIDGFLCVAEDFHFARVVDHQFPNAGRGGAESCERLFADWLASPRAAGVSHEPFRVGALDQIALMRNPQAFRGEFSIRNICANGVVWNGRDGTVDPVGEHLAVTGQKGVDQNVLSLGFRIRYGAFSYFASGDVSSRKLRRRDGSEVVYDGVVGRAVGPTTLVKMGHHGCADSVSNVFLDSVRADAYVACMWTPRQAHPDTLSRIAAHPTRSGKRPLILPQLICPLQRQWAEENGWMFPHETPAHVVVRVPRGGETFRVYLLDARDESMRILAVAEV